MAHSAAATATHPDGGCIHDEEWEASLLCRPLEGTQQRALVRGCEAVEGGRVEVVSLGGSRQGGIGRQAWPNPTAAPATGQGIRTNH